MKRMQVSAEAIDGAALRQALQRPDCGGYCAFEGWVRDHNAGAAVDALDYEAYAELTVAEGEAIITEAMARFDIADARCAHRVGALAIGDLAIFIGVAARHRDAAFRACRYIIDEAKQRLPVWKKEHYRDRAATWVDASHEQGGGATAFVPDYSRQTRLPGFGAQGQARLAAARVLVIGAGGLGVPALTYLAAAGVGHLGIVDGDRIEASNLHRQVLYGPADIGERKVDVAARALRALNPHTHIEVFQQPLDADSVVAMFENYDLVLECTDSIASKYLGSDAAVLTGTPIVFASVYQYEGQVHAYAADGRSPCLRCLWPTPPDPATVGTCAQGGVLGPVPGVLGALQAMEAIKRLVGLPGVVDEHVLLVNLLDHGLQRIAASRCPPCLAAGRCVRVDNLDHWRAQGAAMEVSFANLVAARAAGYTIIDIRNADELAAMPAAAPTLWIPMAQFLAGPVALGPGKQLIVCAHGQRSWHVAALLRQQGNEQVFSLRGGLAALSQ